MPENEGRGLIEFAMLLPMLIVIVLGVVEIGYALVDQHVVTKITREGSNLISRDALAAGCRRRDQGHAHAARRFQHRLAADLLGGEEGGDDLARPTSTKVILYPALRVRRACRRSSVLRDEGPGVLRRTAQL